MLQIFKEIKKPTDSLLKHYRDQFIRNQNKWIRRSKITVEQLDAEFKMEGKEFFLRGSFSATEFLLEEVGTERFFRSDVDRVSSSILTE
jgi:hypothetical protein